MFCGHENIAVSSLAALVAGLAHPKTTLRRRNLYCQFNLDDLVVDQLEQLGAKAVKLGDYVLAGHLARDIDTRWRK